ASIVINGAFFDGIDPPLSPEDSPSQLAFEAIMVHEVGHFANLDHSVVNHELAADGDPDNDIYIPTMYPLVVEDESAIATLNPDDETALASLYPTSGFAGATARVFGRIRDDGIPFQGANVVVRRRSGKAPPTDRLMFAYSGISGARYFPCNPGGSCSPGTPPDLAGEYAVAGLPQGNYDICVEQIDRRLSVANGTFIGPLATPATVLGPEECFGATEGEVAEADDPDDVDLVFLGTGTNVGPLDIHLNDLPVSDPFEPNNTLGTPAVLPDLVAGADTSGAILGAGDLDFYQIPVTPGDIVRIDIEAAEFGSTLDPVIGLYDQTNTFLGTIDDSVDPDSGSPTLDPADSFDVGFSGTFKLVVSSYPDLDLDGVGGATTGPYLIRVVVDHDADADRVADRHDRCQFDPADDADDDGRCESLDNCDTTYNPTQTDTDADGVGVACDNCNPTTFTTLFDFQLGAPGWSHMGLLGSVSTWHTANTACFGTSLPSQMFLSNGNAGPVCSLDSSTEHSMLISPPIILPSSGTSTLMFDALSFDEAGRCLASG
ncbi:MAG: hypothetical protein ACRDKW_09565, partial [Actinomycetota bacterium]